MPSDASIYSYGCKPPITTENLYGTSCERLGTKRTQRRLNYRVNLDLQWIGSCANASQANRDGSKGTPVSNHGVPRRPAPQLGEPASFSHNPALYRSIWPTSPEQVREIAFSAWASNAQA
jgi:hypothetical protein